MSKSDQAVMQFLDGFRCSQAVLGAYAQDFNLDIDLARKISLGLAAGSGNGGECGAVSAAYLVLGLKFGFPDPGEPEKLSRMFDRIQAFSQRFKMRHEQIDCPKLIGLDIFSPEGRQAFADNDIKKLRCVNFVKDAVLILEEIM